MPLMRLGSYLPSEWLQTIQNDSLKERKKLMQGKWISVKKKVTVCREVVRNKGMARLIRWSWMVAKLSKIHNQLKLQNLVVLCYLRVSIDNFLRSVQLVLECGFNLISFKAYSLTDSWDFWWICNWLLKKAHLRERLHCAALYCVHSNRWKMILSLHMGCKKYLNTL